MTARLQELGMLTRLYNKDSNEAKFILVYAEQLTKLPIHLIHRV